MCRRLAVLQSARKAAFLGLALGVSPTQRSSTGKRSRYTQTSQLSYCKPGKQANRSSKLKGYLKTIRQFRAASQFSGSLYSLQPSATEPAIAQTLIFPCRVASPNRGKMVQPYQARRPWAAGLRALPRGLPAGRPKGLPLPLGLRPPFCFQPPPLVLRGALLRLRVGSMPSMVNSGSLRPRYFSILCTATYSFTSAKVRARPWRPARPVRPMRCT